MQFGDRLEGRYTDSIHGVHCMHAGRCYSQMLHSQRGLQLALDMSLLATCMSPTLVFLALDTVNQFDHILNLRLGDHVKVGLTCLCLLAGADGSHSVGGEHAAAGEVETPLAHLQHARP